MAEENEAVGEWNNQKSKGPALMPEPFDFIAG